MDNDGHVEYRDSVEHVDSKSEGQATASAVARTIDRVASGPADLVQMVREAGYLVRAPERPLTMPERVDVLERRYKEMEIVACVFAGALLMAWLLRR
jgi:hypothetical protein